MSSLFVIRGNDQGTRYELDDPAVGIGRDSSNPIQLHDTEVSRRHAEIREVDERQFAVIDLGSSNGTFVNNRRIQHHMLESGDEVRIGSTVMIYKGPGEDTAGLAEKVSIVAAAQPASEDDSNIVHTLSQEESSRMMQGESGKTQSPWLTRALSNLEVMYRTTLAISHTLDIDQLLSRILQLIFEWVEAERGCMLLLDNQTRELVPKVRRNRRETNQHEKINISQTIIDYVMRTGQGALTSDAKDDSRWNPAASILQHNIREAICVPMQGRHDDMVGLIYIDTLTPPERILTHGSANKFNEEHLRLMIAIGHQAAMAVEDSRYYTELMQAERLAAIGQTIATLSHHIKNILQGIKGGSYLIDMGLTSHAKELENEAVSPEKVGDAAGMIRKGWDIVEKNQNKISTLVMDMLTFSKEREPALEPYDLNQVVGDVVELMESRAADHNCKLRWVPTTEMPTLVFDPEGMHRAILNCVTNAIDACDDAERPQVAVATEFDESASEARVVIEDNGIGIPPEQIEKIFVLFNSSKKGGRGTGLGLSVSNKIMHEHGGRINVESKVGHGSRFTLVLPASYPESDDDTQDEPSGSQPAEGADPKEKPPAKSTIDSRKTATLSREDMIKRLQEQHD